MTGKEDRRADYIFLSGYTPPASAQDLEARGMVEQILVALDA